MEPEVDLSPEEMKEAEREVIQRQIETTEAQLEAMEKMEEAAGEMLDDATVQALKDAGIHVGQVMQFACTLELSAPKDLAKMYNFNKVKSNLPRDDINLQFCRGVLKDKRAMLEEMKSESVRRKSLLDPQTLLLLKSQEGLVGLFPYLDNSLDTSRNNYWKKGSGKAESTELGRMNDGDARRRLLQSTDFWQIWKSNVVEDRGSKGQKRSSGAGKTRKGAMKSYFVCWDQATENCGQVWQ